MTITTMAALTLFTYRFEALSGSEAVLEVTLFITIFHQQKSHQFDDMFRIIMWTNLSPYKVTL